MFIIYQFKSEPHGKCILCILEDEGPKTTFNSVIMYTPLASLSVSSYYIFNGKNLIKLISQMIH